MKKFILHISHTDISRDSRILKEMNEIKSNFPEFNVLGIGIKKNYTFSQNKTTLFKKDLLNLTIQSKKIFFLPKFFR